MAFGSNFSVADGAVMMVFPSQGLAGCRKALGF